MRKLVLGIISIGSLLLGSTVSAQSVMLSSPSQDKTVTVLPVSSNSVLDEQPKPAEATNYRKLVITPSKDLSKPFVILTVIHNGFIDDEIDGEYKIRLLNKNDSVGWTPIKKETVQFNEGMASLPLESNGQSTQKLWIWLDDFALLGRLNFTFVPSAGSNIEGQVTTSTAAGDNSQTYYPNTTTWEYTNSQSMTEPDPVVTNPVPNPQPDPSNQDTQVLTEVKQLRKELKLAKKSDDQATVSNLKTQIKTILKANPTVKDELKALKKAKQS